MCKATYSKIVRQNGECFTYFNEIFSIDLEKLILQ